MSNVHHYTQVPKVVSFYVETKQKYLKNMSKEKQMQHVKVGFMGQEDQKKKTVQFVSRGACLKAWS